MKRSGPLRRTTRLRARSATPPTHRSAEATEEAYARVRAQVLARDGYRCRNPACRRVKGLEVHHVIERSSGGSDAPGNLITICAFPNGGCHRAIHDGRLKLRIIETTRTDVELAWTDERPRQTGW